MEQILNQTQRAECHSSRVHTRGRSTPPHLDEHVDVVCDLQSHHFDLVLLRTGRRLLDGVGVHATCGAASRHLVRLQSVSRLPLQGDAQLPDVDLQTSGEVLQPAREQSERRAGLARPLTGLVLT